MTLVILTLAFYRRAYQAPCADGSCAGRTCRAALWMVAPLVLVIPAVPYVTPYLASAEANAPLPTTAPSGHDACCAAPAQKGGE